MRKTIITCDIKGCTEKAFADPFSIQVIFHTEQTEGRGTNSYLFTEKIDLCTKCHKKILDGNYVHAHGAMGHNEYYFMRSK